MSKALEVYNKLLFTGGIAFGSRALGVSTEKSDYDIAITIDQLNTAIDTGLIRKTYSSWDIYEYFEVIPRNNDGYLIRQYNSNLDILVLPTMGDLLIMKSAMQHLNTLDKELITNKEDRVEQHSNALLERGWVLRKK